MTASATAGPPRDAEQRLVDGHACLRAALDYLGRGWSAILLCPPDHWKVWPKHLDECTSPGKSPLGKWKRFQSQRATEQELRDWSKNNRTCNVGMVYGEVSGLVGIDIDGAQGEESLARISDGQLPPTLEFMTPGGGRRLLFRIPPGVRVKTTVHKAGIKQEVRLQAEGAQTVMPPSRHPNGGQYAWKPDCGPGEIEPALAPAWLIRELEHRPAPHPKRNNSTGPGPGSVSTKLRDRVIAYLARCEPAVSGQGGHARTMEVARAVVWGFDLGAAAGFDLLQEHYNPRCQPPWSDAELLHKCQEADTVDFGKERGWLLREDRRPAPAPLPGQNGPEGNGHVPHDRPPPNKDGGERINLTDRGNALRLVDRHGKDLRHCHPWKKWLAWDGRRWREDDTAQAVRWAKETISSLFEWACEEIARVQKECRALGPDDKEERKRLVEELERFQELQKWCLKSEAGPRLGAMLELARSDRPVPVLPAQLDPNPWLLNCPNGTLDLAVGELRRHDRGHNITRLCPVAYDPAAPCPAWERFLASVFQGDTELIVFMQRLCGLILTGDVREHILLVLWGKGANGKSTLVNVLLELLGRDYAIKAPPDLLMARKGESHPTERADLYGRRLVVCSETPQGRRLNEALVKDMTGGEPIRARRMREDFWEFEPTHKVFLCTNHKPAILGTDEGIWRRIRLVPFEVTFWDQADPGKRGARDERLRQDKALPGKLRTELPGILAWCVRGCLDWQRDGLTLPQKVQAATNEYRAAEDAVGQFLDECCTVNLGFHCKASALFQRYSRWCETTGEKPSSQRAFGEALTERGFRRRTSNGTWYDGLDLKSDSDGQSATDSECHPREQAL